jgi:hypothetical protein
MEFNIVHRFLLLALLVLGINTSLAQCPEDKAAGLYTHVTVASIKVMTGKVSESRANAYLDETMNNAYAYLPQDCKDQFQQSQVHTYTDCSELLRRAQANISNHMNTVINTYANDGNEIILLAQTHRAMNTFVASVPSRCWFAGIGGNVLAGSTGGGGGCGTLESNYQSCKRESNDKAKRCTVDPRACRSMPTCIFPSSINPRCAP